MKEEKIENEKFILKFHYDEKLKKFENINYTNKNMSSLEKKILEESLLLFSKCKLQELYEHLTIRVENKMRDFNKIKYSGILFPENVSKEHMYFHDFFRKLLHPYINDDLKKRINFQAKKPKESWNILDDKQKKERIYGMLKDFIASNYQINHEINVKKIENKVDIFLELSDKIDIATKSNICLDFEIYIKQNLDDALSIYLERMMDQSKLRRLKV
jgi:hypothetical protein